MSHAQTLPPDIKRQFLALVRTWRDRGLSARACTVLALAGCDTVEQVTALGRSHFAGKPNCATKTLQELADLAGWPPEQKTAVDAIAKALGLAIPDPEEAREAATDAVIGLRRAGFVIVSGRPMPTASQRSA